MAKGKNAHQEIEKLKSEYMQAYKLVYGEIQANLRVLVYKSGWFIFCDKKQYEDNPDNLVGVPYSAKEIEDMTLMLGRKIPQRDDSDDDLPE